MANLMEQHRYWREITAPEVIAKRLADENDPLTIAMARIFTPELGKKFKKLFDEIDDPLVIV
jgi:hypothetical protein